MVITQDSADSISALQTGPMDNLAQASSVLKCHCQCVVHQAALAVLVQGYTFLFSCKPGPVYLLWKEKGQGKTRRENLFAESLQVAGSVKIHPILTVLRNKNEQCFQEHGTKRRLVSFLGAKGKGTGDMVRTETAAQHFKELGPFQEV